MTKKAAVETTASAAEMVVQALEEEIIFGHLHPRERLVEDELMLRHGAKRHVVREALVELERRGIVVRERNKGSKVRDFEPSEVEALWEMRALLHHHAAERIPLPAEPALIDRLSDLHQRHSQAVREKELHSVYRLNNEFHETLFGACGNDYLAQAITDHAWLGHAIRSYTIGDPELLRHSMGEHAAMIEAMRAGDRERLVTLCVDHINASKNAYLASQRRAR